MFDRLLLLDKGGTTLYFGDIGPDGSTLIDYFETNGARKCQADDNPAEWMLEVTGNMSQAGVEDHGKELSPWAGKWNLSPQRQAVLERLEGLKPDVSSPPPSEDSGGEYATSFPKQLIIVSKRIFQDQWRDPAYLFSKIALSFLLVSGISYHIMSCFGRV